MTSFQTGQRVKFLNDVGSATVVRVEGSTVVVEDEDGFERSVSAAELMAAPDPEVEARQNGDTIPDVAQLLAQEVGEKRMRELQKDFEVGTNMRRRPTWLGEMPTWRWTSTSMNWSTIRVAFRTAPNNHSNGPLTNDGHRGAKSCVVSCSFTAWSGRSSAPNPNPWSSITPIVRTEKATQVRVRRHRSVAGPSVVAQPE